MNVLAVTETLSAKSVANGSTMKVGWRLNGSARYITQLSTIRGIAERFAQLRVGEKVKLEIIGDGRKRSINARIAEPERTTAEAAGLSEQFSGATLGAIEEGHPLAGKVEGVEVIDVERGSAAARAGLRRGDIIISVNCQPVKRIEDARRAAEASQRGILLNIRRGNGALFIVIQ